MYVAKVVCYEVRARFCCVHIDMGWLLKLFYVVHFFFDARHILSSQRKALDCVSIIFYFVVL